MLYARAAGFAPLTRGRAAIPSRLRAAGGERIWVGLVRLKAIVVCIALFAALGAVALGHTERPSYFPDPAPDNGVQPAAGGQVPKARSLASALQAEAAGQDARGLQGRARCAALRKLDQEARAKRLRDPPERPPQCSSGKQARRLQARQRKLKKRCRYREIQPAVDGVGQQRPRGDHARALHRADLARQADERPELHRVRDQRRPSRTRPGALSYAYQFNCPNDQNLIAVIGRQPGTGEDPDPPRFNRHGIPNLGPVHPLQRPDRGVRRQRPTTWSSTRATPPRATAGRRAWARRRTWRSVPTAPTGSSCAT